MLPAWWLASTLGKAEKALLLSGFSMCGSIAVAPLLLASRTKK